MPGTLKREDQIDDQYRDKFDRSQLRSAEQATGQDASVNAGIDQLEKYANDPANVSKNLDTAREGEQSAAQSNPFNFQPQDKKLGIKGKATFAKKLGPAGVITLLFGGGGGIFMMLLSPGIALVHIKEVVENKIDSMSSVIEVRSNKLMASRLLGGTDSAVSRKCAKGSLLCRKYSTLGKAQVQALNDRGYHVLDKDGKPISPDSADKIKGIKKIQTPNGDTIRARDYTKRVTLDASFRNDMRGVFPSKFAVWNDKIGQKWATTKKLVRDPKWTNSEEGGDEKKNKQGINKNLRQATTNGQNMLDNESAINKGDYGGAIDSETSKLQTSENPGSIDLSPEGVAKAPEVQAGLGTKIKNGALSALNPTSALVGICMTNQYIKTIVYTARVIAAVQAIRFASQFLSTADKIKAGEATPNDVSSAMNILEKQNAVGDSFGDATGYTYPQYGTVSSNTNDSGAGGTMLMTFFSSVLAYEVGHSATKLAGKACPFVTNTIVQIIFSVGTAALHIVGIGELLDAAKAASSGGIKLAINNLTKKMSENFVKKLAEKGITKEALKENKWAIGKTLLKQAAGIGGVFLAGYFIARVIVPYLANVAAGTLFNGDIDGVKAMDTITSGAGAMNAGVAQNRGLMPVTKSQYTAYMQFNDNSTNQYVADMKAQANPFDIYNPYSASNSVGFAVGNLFSSINVAKSPQSLLSLPSTVFGALNPFAGAKAFAASDQENAKQITNACTDSDVQNTNIATDPFCNPIYGMDSSALNVSPEAVADYMLSHGYIDASGAPIGEYQDYVNTCFSNDNPNISVISSGALEGEGALPKECITQDGSDNLAANFTDNATAAVGATTDSAVYKNQMFHLYQIDNGIIDSMDNGFPTVGGAPSQPGEAGTFTVASFNMCHEINHPIGSGSMCKNLKNYGVDEKRDREAATITGAGDAGNPQFDIVGAQEISQPTQSVILTKDSNYESFPSTTHPYKDSKLNLQSVPSSNGKAIFWNTQKFSFDSGGFLYGVAGNGSSKSAANNSFPWVQLSSASGQTVYVMSMHTPNNGYGDIADRNRDAQQVLAWAKTKATGSNLVIITGDMNTSKDGKKPPFYCTMTAGGTLQYALDLQQGNNSNTACPTSGLPIDQIYNSTNVSDLTATGWKRLDGGDSHLAGTDHSPAWVTYNIGGSNGGSSGSFSGSLAWPVDKKWWTGYKNDFLNAHTMISGTFTSPYTKGLAADISSPPKGTPIYSMADGKVSSASNCAIVISSNIAGGTLEIAYGHGDPKVTKDQTVKAGQQISSENEHCKATGPHVHIDMSFNGQHICPQDVFIAMGNNQSPDFAALTKKAKAPCGRA